MLKLSFCHKTRLLRSTVYCQVLGACFCNPITQGRGRRVYVGGHPGPLSKTLTQNLKKGGTRNKQHRSVVENFWVQIPSTKKKKVQTKHPAEGRHVGQQAIVDFVFPTALETLTGSLPSLQVSATFFCQMNSFLKVSSLTLMK